MPRVRRLSPDVRIGASRNSSTGYLHGQDRAVVVGPEASLVLPRVQAGKYGGHHGAGAQAPLVKAHMAAGPLSSHRADLDLEADQGRIGGYHGRADGAPDVED